MQKEGAIEMFSRTIEKHKLRHTIYDGDDDSSSFGSVKEVLNEKFGDEYPIEKEDCIGHKHSGEKLSNEKGVDSSGRLTDLIFDWIQTYYGYPIRNNKGKTEAIQKAIRTFFYHTFVRSPNKNLTDQHAYCLVNSNSWCKW